jgi:hypothetical protein
MYYTRLQPVGDAEDLSDATVMKVKTVPRQEIVSSAVTKIRIHTRIKKERRFSQTKRQPDCNPECRAEQGIM